MKGRLHFSLSRGVTVASLVLLAVSISAFTSFSSNLLSLPSLGEPSKNLPLHNVGPPGVASLAKDKGKLKELISNLPLAFEANIGQVDQRVKFLSRGLASDLLLGSKEAMLRLRRSGTPLTFRDLEHGRGPYPISSANAVISSAKRREASAWSM